MRKFLTVFVAVAGLLAFASAAWAVTPPAITMVPHEEASGTGVLNGGGTLGFEAKDDLTGSIEYHSADGTLTVHCNDINGWIGRVSKKGWNDASFGSNNCAVPGEDPAYRVWIDALDRGEGENAPQDKIHIKVFSWPDRVLLFEEQGPILDGNVQVNLH